MFARVTNVSETETDVLVHVITSEGDDIRTTMFHPFYVKSIVEENGSRYNGEWKAALNLIAGDELLADDGRVIYVEEVRIERLAKNIKVYNLEIGDLHTYFVTGGVLVHNYCTPQELNKKKNDVLAGEDVEFDNLDDALSFIKKKFPMLPQEIAGQRSAEGWHFDIHPINNSVEDIEHINMYSKSMKFRVHITWKN